MTTHPMKHVLALALVALFPRPCLAQGTTAITFDGDPVQPPGTAALVQYYTESGFLFLPLPGSAGFVRVGRNPTLTSLPDNGTAYLQAGVGSTLAFNHGSGIQFDLISSDVAEYSTVTPEPVSISFIGYRADGSSVRTNFTTDGIIDGTGPLADFQTLYFAQEWTGLIRVEIPTYGWSLDNVAISIPEPNATILVAASVLTFNILRRRKNDNAAED